MEKSFEREREQSHSRPVIRVGRHSHILLCCTTMLGRDKTKPGWSTPSSPPPPLRAAKHGHARMDTDRKGDTHMSTLTVLYGCFRKQNKYKIILLQPTASGSPPFFFILSIPSCLLISLFKMFPHEVRP